MSPICKISFFRNVVLLCLLMFVQNFSIQAQSLPSERSCDWSLAGFRGQIPTEFSTTLNIQYFGGIADGVTDNSSAFLLALESLVPNGGVIFFPAGTYFFGSQINLPDGVVIRGDGSDLTLLKFDLEGIDDLISVNGENTSLFSNLSEDVSKGEQSISVENASGFIPGDYIRLIQNDSHLVHSNWAIGSVGQIVQIIQVDGNVLLLNSELRRDYQLDDAPKVQKLNMRKNVGIECLKIERLDETNPFHTSNINFEYAAQCWVQGVESTNCNFAHVDIKASSNITLTGNYFHHAFDYGGGGRAYGLMIQSTGNEILTENNIFEHLRHAMIVQSGANGNVFAYNYSTDPFWTGTSFPSDAAGDLVCHGNYVYGNLFEGNIGQQIVIDNSHGANGPFNTFFRNRLESYGIVMSADNSPTQNFLGNEITNGTPGAAGFYFLQGVDHFQVGNNLGGEITPTGTSILDDHSCYLDSTPSFYHQMTFPSIGMPNELNSGALPALDRWNDNNTLTFCSSACNDEDLDFICDTIDNCLLVNNINQLDTDLDGIGDLCDNCPENANTNQEDLDGNGIGDACEEITSTINPLSTENWKIYPNPAKDILFLELETTVERSVIVQIYSTLGQLVLQKEIYEKQTQLSLNDLSSGNYIIHVLTNENLRSSQLFSISKK
ncbi:MAG: T9SS type A sorting domain-containing protein [Saprospiraceae bacterium]